MSPHTYTATDFQNLDPDALKALGVKRLTPKITTYRTDKRGSVKQSEVLIDFGAYSIALVPDAAAALLIGMVAGRCDEFHCGRFRENYFWSELHGAGSTGGTSERVSPLAAALAAYGEMVRSQRKEDGDGK